MNKRDFLIADIQNNEDKIREIQKNYDRLNRSLIRLLCRIERLKAELEKHG